MDEYVAPSPPSKEDFEIVVLGRGVGESVLVHLPGGRWIVVDSFYGVLAGDDERDAAPLRYLSAIGVDPQAAVEAVVLTHLHEDHCLGIDRVVLACPEARVWFSGALPQADLGQILAQLSLDPATADRPRADAIREAFRVADDEDRLDFVGAVQTPLDDDSVRVIGPGSTAQRWARDPDGILNPTGVRKLRRHNATSVVLLITVDEAQALLTGDLEKHRRIGWQGMMRRLRGRDLSGIGFVKAPHHGSVGAHHPAMYEEWTADAVVAVTPNLGAANDLPRDEGVEKLKAASRQVWIAGPRTKALADETSPSAVDEEIWWVAAVADRASGEWAVRAGRPGAQRL